MKKLKTLLIITVTILFACQEGKQPNSNAPADAKPNEQFKDRKRAKTSQKPIKSPISSPEKMFGYIHNHGVDYRQELMNAPKKAESYLTPQEKALNFGIYTTDLAYSAAYQDIESTVDLYKIVKRLSSELDIAEVMSPEMVERMQANMENPDSLAVVAGQAYYQAVEFLENNRQSGKLALMSVGGWIESLYITMNAIEGEQNVNAAKQKVAEQKKIFQSLYAYLEKHQKELGVEETMKSLKPIAEIYGQISSDEGSLKINDSQYEQLKKAVSNYRAQLIAIE